MQLRGSLASHAANAINNAQLYREATRQAQRMSALADLGRLVSERLDLALVGQRVSDSVRHLPGFRSSSLYRIDPETEALVAFAVTGEVGVAIGRDTVFPRGHAVVGVALRERAPVATPNLLADPRFIFTEEARASIERIGNRSVLAVPLRVGERVIGALGVGDQVGRRFDDDEIRLAEAFADQAALALENARLYTEATRRRLEAEELARPARIFSEAEVGLLQAFGDQAALALENAQLYEENRRQVEELSVLLELSRAVTGQLDRSTLLEAIHTQAGRILDAANMAIVLRDEERGDLEVGRASWRER